MTSPNQWLALSDPMEVVPENDTWVHASHVNSDWQATGWTKLTDGKCFCEPELVDGVWIHKAMDGRRFYE